MGLFSPKTFEQTPTQKVSEALGAFTQAQTNLQDVLQGLKSEKEILEAQLSEVTDASKRAESILGKIGDLLG